jgi:hypothetical protein
VTCVFARIRTSVLSIKRQTLDHFGYFYTKESARIRTSVLSIKRQTLDYFLQVRAFCPGVPGYFKPCFQMTRVSIIILCYFYQIKFKLCIAGASQDENCLPIIAEWNDDGVSAKIFVFRDGVIEEKFVSFHMAVFI